jgi:hypothetical protein
MLIGLQCAVRALSYGSRKPRTSNAMKRLAFISRHAPTQEQIEIAAMWGFEIIHVGDVDAFDSKLHYLVEEKIGDCHAVAAVHPNVCLMAHMLGHFVWVFQNSQRAAEGGKPQFYCSGFAEWGHKVISENGDTMATWRFHRKDSPFAGEDDKPWTPCRSA